MPIKTITIDFWNTLYDSSGGEGRERERQTVVVQHATRLGATLAPERLKHAQKQTWQHFSDVWKEQHRTPPTRSMVEYFWATLGVEADAKAIDDVTHVFCEGVLNHPPALLPHVAESLAELAGSGVEHIALISDTAFSPGRVLKQIMARDGIARYFNVFSFSDETGVAKPNPKAYHTALVGTSAAPHECVHIGDIERTDIVGAKNLGMKAILFAGDPNNTMNHEHRSEETQADARADSWLHIVEIVRSL